MPCVEPSLKGPLPFMKTMEDALAVCERENDNFYLTAFMLEVWLGDVTCRTVAQYAEIKSARERILQQGLAAECFGELFGHVTDAEYHHPFQSLARFAQFDDAQTHIVRRAYWMMSLEFPKDSWPKPARDAESIAACVAFMRRIVHRLGEWVEAVIHSQTHFFSHQEPLAFDADPEKRELAILGIQQRHFRDLDDFQKAWRTKRPGFKVIRLWTIVSSCFGHWCAATIGPILTC